MNCECLNCPSDQASLLGPGNFYYCEECWDASCTYYKSRCVKVMQISPEWPTLEEQYFERLRSIFSSSDARTP